MKNNQPARIVSITILVAVLISPGAFWQMPECAAQNRLGPADYDYHSLALASIANSTREASKLPGVPQKVKLSLYAAKVLAPFQRDEAIRLLDVSLVDLKQWVSVGKVSGYQRYLAGELRNDVLGLYASLDSEKATALQKEFQAAAKATASNTDATSLKKEHWFAQSNNRRTNADQYAKIAFSLLDSEPGRAVALVMQSLQEGSVSGVLYQIVERLVKNGNRALLNRIELGIGKVLAAMVTRDPSSLAYACALLEADKNRPAVMTSAVIAFNMRSVQAWADLITDPRENGKIDGSYINDMFQHASISVRPMITQYAPEQLPMFEQALERLAPMVPAETRSRLQAFQPETILEPRDLLNDILKDPAPGKRELRLVRLISLLLRKESADFQKNLELAADAIDGFADMDVKSAYIDLLTITRIDSLVQQQKYIDAQQLTLGISSIETRAWALLALATAATKTDRVLAFEIISNALKALDKTSPTPHKVELALAATAMLAANDPERAFETFVTAAKYANSSPANVDPPAKPAVGFGLKVTIGSLDTNLGVFPESFDELRIEPALSLLGIADWFRADQIVNDIREPGLRLQLKLKLAASVLAQESKRRPPAKQPAKN